MMLDATELRQIHSLVNEDDDYILMELNEIADPEWWDTCINREDEEVFWSAYYNRCEEIAIERGLKWGQNGA